MFLLITIFLSGGWPAKNIPPYGDDVDGDLQDSMAMEVVISWSSGLHDSSGAHCSALRLSWDTAWILGAIRRPWRRAGLLFVTLSI